jgi:5,10-methylenetetrahydromethanopterin reductase
MRDRVSLLLQDQLSVLQTLDLVKYAEARGFDTAWQSETRLSRDSMTMMALMAHATARLKVGCSAVNHWTRHITTLASELLTLDEYAQDRVICSLGTWSDVSAQKVGVARDKPLIAMRETVTVLRRLLNMERVTFLGETITLRDFSLEAFAGRRDPRRIPIYVGATGVLLPLAGEIADGVLLNYLVSPAYTQYAVEQIEIGARKSNREIYDLDIPQLILCSVDIDRRKALDVARKAVTQAIIQQPQLMRANGVPKGVIDEVLNITENPSDIVGLTEAMRWVTDDVVQLVTASGTPLEVKAKVRDYVSAGASSPVLVCLNEDIRLVIDVFADGFHEKPSSMKDFAPKPSDKR